MKSELNRSRQRGQTILWFLATATACCAAFALVYNIGQVTNEKEKTVNAADASAISGALTEARILNFEAYTNRALIANEVSIAQLVSLDSWMAYNYEMTQWLDNYFGWIPIVGDALAALAGGAQAAAAGINGFVTVSIPVIEGINTALETARDSVNLVGAVAANGIATGVANANQTVFGNRYDEQPEMVSLAAVAVNEYAWWNFTDPYKGDQRADAKKVILNSRDPFATHRGNGWLLDAINTATEIAGGGGWIAPVLTVDKTSGSSDLKDFNHWQAQDSADLTLHHLGVCGTFPFNYPCIQSDPLPVPIGYGRADADSDGSVGDNLCWVSGGTANCTLAMQNSDNFSWQGPYLQFSGDTGMPDIRDLAKGLAKDGPCSKNNGSDSPSLTFVSAVQKKGAATLTTPRLGMDADTPGPQGSARVVDNLQNNDHLTSIATACTFFLRPDLNSNDRTQGSLARMDGVHEFASLYNPYWQARLGATDPKLKAALYVLISVNPLLSAVTP
jgi:hypothetical protein